MLAEHNDVAAIIAEPLQRVIPADPGYLQGLRALCDKYHILLIFDEIVTGFRMAYGGAQKRYGVTPDICTLGKIIGGGFGIFGGFRHADVQAFPGRDVRFDPCGCELRMIRNNVSLPAHGFGQAAWPRHEVASNPSSRIRNAEKNPCTRPQPKDIEPETKS